MANTGLFTAATGTGGYLPDDYAGLIQRPVEAQSLAFQLSTLATTSRHSLEFPVLDTDATAAWTAEGQDITASNPGLDTLVCTPSKVAGLVAISNEMANDSDPASASVVGMSLARSLTKAVDAAFFGSTTTNGPSGLGSITPTALTYPTAGATNFDPFAAAINAAENLGYSLAGFVVDQTMAQTLAELKDEADSNRPLLAVDATNSMHRTILGVPLLSSPYVTAGTIWGIPKAVSFVVQREGIQLEVDRSVYFNSDRVAARAVARIGFAFPHEAGIIKLTAAAA